MGDLYTREVLRPHVVLEHIDSIWVSICIDAFWREMIRLVGLESTHSTCSLREDRIETPMFIIMVQEQYRRVGFTGLSNWWLYLGIHLCIGLLNIVEMIDRVLRMIDALYLWDDKAYFIF